MKQLQVLLCVALLAGLPVAAQQLEFGGPITSGWLSVEPPAGAPYITTFHTVDFDLTGQGFHVVGTRGDGGSVGVLSACDIPGCVSGQTVNMSATFGNLDMGSGTATIGTQVISPAYYSGGFRFIAGDATLPNGNRRDVVLTAPFTLDTGGYRLDIFTTPGARPSGDPAYFAATGRFSGKGTATAFLERTRIADMHSWFYRVRRVVFTFE